MQLVHVGVPVSSEEWLFLLKNNCLLVINMTVFNFQNMMDMHKGYAY
jgi:hypothetical protein